MILTMLNKDEVTRKSMLKSAWDKLVELEAAALAQFIDDEIIKDALNDGEDDGKK